jgi:hypothetical protein
MRRYGYLPPIILICLVLGLAVARNLRRGNAYFSDTAIMMGTVVEISVWGDGRVEPGVAVEEAFAEIAGVDSLFGCGMVYPGAAGGLESSPAFRQVLDVSLGFGNTVMVQCLLRTTAQPAR